MDSDVGRNIRSERGGDIQIDAGFPGGNFVVDRVTHETVFLHQDLANVDVRDTTTWWLYWYFRVRGAASRVLTFHFIQGDVIGTCGPAVVTDDAPDGPGGATFRYRFGPGENETRFAFSLPYGQSDLEALFAKHRTSPWLQRDEPCRTPKGRVAELLYAGCLDGDAKCRVLLACRHHACESVASYVIEGLLATVVAPESDAGDHPAAGKAGCWLRRNVEFLAVPFVDKDGVEDGNQGELRHPRDHNRDYDGVSVHATTCALRALVPRWSEGRVPQTGTLQTRTLRTRTLRTRTFVALDLHCPWIRGARNEVVYFVGGPNQRNWAEVRRLSAILERVCSGPLPYRRSDNLAYGQAWNTPENASQGKSFGRWATELPGIRLATSLEIPYATVHAVDAVADAMVTPDAARALGRDIACALCHYLSEET